MTQKGTQIHDVESMTKNSNELYINEKVVHDGGAARQAVQSKDAPINAAIVGIVDHPEHFL